MANTITEGIFVGERGSKAYLLPQIKEFQTKHQLLATKRFDSSSSLRSWLEAPMTSKLYKILHVDWTRNSVKVECIPLAAAIGAGDNE